MRSIALPVLFGLVGLASCTTAPPPMTRTAEGQQAYDRLLAGKVAGPPMQCLQSMNMNDMTVIDESTVAYKRGSTVYISHMQGPCSGLGSGSAVMVTRSFGTAESCRGDIVRMVDPTSHIDRGSCVFGEFTPYKLAR